MPGPPAVEHALGLADSRCPSVPQGILHFQLGRGEPMLHTRLRPHCREFLEKVARLYELHVFTFGSRLYAHTIAGERAARGSHSPRCLLFCSSSLGVSSIHLQRVERGGGHLCERDIHLATEPHGPGRGQRPPFAPRPGRGHSRAVGALSLRGGGGAGAPGQV